MHDNLLWETKETGSLARDLITHGYLDIQEAKQNDIYEQH
jgi:hypothetical protein